MYNAIICGAGSIGADKDDCYDSPVTNAILTHGHAFFNHPDTKLVAIVDIDLTKAIKVGKKWGSSAYNSLAQLGSIPTAIDIIVIATPTETHHDMLMRALSLQPKIVICEKPFCSDLKESREIHDAYNSAEIPILVNYTRRFDPVASGIFDRLRDGRYGEIYHARCLYGRGLRRDGCHGLDLLLYTLGRCTGLSYDHHTIIDYLPEDPSYTVRLQFEKCREAYMVGTDSRKWGAFELEFVTEAGVIRFSDWGKVVRHFGVGDEETFGQYYALASAAPRVQTGLTKALLYMVDNAVRHIRNGAPLLCTSADAIRVHEVMEQIK